MMFNACYVLVVVTSYLIKVGIRYVVLGGRNKRRYMYVGPNRGSTIFFLVFIYVLM